jgi:hypothetical protein
MHRFAGLVAVLTLPFLGTFPVEEDARPSGKWDSSDLLLIFGGASLIWLLTTVTAKQWLSWYWQQHIRLQPVERTGGRRVRPTGDRSDAEAATEPRLANAQQGEAAPDTELPTFARTILRSSSNSRTGKPRHSNFATPSQCSE